MKASRSEPSVEELVQLLKRSDLPTVVVEGPDDVTVYRGVEDILGSLNASFIHCSGRVNLLSLFDRRSEFKDKKVCFVADRDMWVFAGIPPEYSEILFSNGYSIENDIYEDGEVERLIQLAERENHSVIIDEVCRWFAFQLELYIFTGTCKTDPNLNHLIPLPGYVCSPAVLAGEGFKEPNPRQYRMIRDEYMRKLRGKLLFEIIVRFSHAPRREPKHSYGPLVAFAVACAADRPSIQSLVGSIKSKLAA